MGWFDNLIGWFSPKTACEREAWRLQLQQLRGAGYDAADHGRLNANWQAYNESADVIRSAPAPATWSETATWPTKLFWHSAGMWWEKASPCKPAPRATN